MMNSTGLWNVSANQTLQEYYEYTDSEAEKIEAILVNLDITLRFIVVAEHLFYFCLVAVIAELRSTSFIYLHHVNLINLLICAHYLAFMKNLRPYLGNRELNHVFCTISEIAWAWMKYMRSYSLFLLTFQRFTAAYYPKLFDRLKSRSGSALTLLSTWLIVLATVLVKKFSLNTRYGMIYCTDGFSQQTLNSFLYFSLYCVMGVLVPVLLSMVLYELIHRKVKQLASSLNKQDDEESKKARQYFILSLIVFISGLMNILISLRVLKFVNFDTYTILVIRIFNHLSIGMVPITLIRYNVIMLEWLKKQLIRFKLVSTRASPTQTTSA
nr:G protein-coupled receptor [Proales similis]